MRILVAEDEPDLNRLLVRNLKNEGYAVDSCLDGEAAWTYLAGTAYDAAVLDIMMPQCDGLTLVRRMRSAHIMTPVLFLTARSEIDERVEGLDSGANDYLTKPFSFKELLARIRVLTRAGFVETTVICKVADLELDPVCHTVNRAGRRIELSAKEFVILEYMMRNAGRVLTREMLIDSAWNYDYEGSSNMIDVYVSRLRRKIDCETDRPLIHTIRNVGYVLKEKA